MTADSHLDLGHPSPVSVGNFIALRFARGTSFSAVNSARSVLSAPVPQVSSQTVGRHPNVCRLIKGVSEERSAQPRYEDTWNVDIVLIYLDQLLEAKPLSLKTCMLLALVTGLRAHVLHILTVEDVKTFPPQNVIIFSQKHKTTKPGSHTESVKILEFRDNAKLCPVKHLKIYLEQT